MTDAVGGDTLSRILNGFVRPSPKFRLRQDSASPLRMAVVEARCARGFTQIDDFFKPVHEGTSLFAC